MDPPLGVNHLQFSFLKGHKINNSVSRVCAKLCFDKGIYIVKAMYYSLFLLW